MIGIFEISMENWSEQKLETNGYRNIVVCHDPVIKNVDKGRNVQILNMLTLKVVAKQCVYVQ